MEAIEQRTGIALSSAFLVHNGRVLDSDRTFGDSGVTNESSINIHFHGLGSGRQLRPHSVNDHFCRVDNVGQGDCVLHSTIDGLRIVFGRVFDRLTAVNLRSKFVSWVRNNLDKVMPNGFTLREIIELEQGESNRSAEEYMNELSISPHIDKSTGRQVDGYYLGNMEIQMLSYMLHVNIDIYQYGNQGATSHRIDSFSTAGSDRPTLSLEYGSPPPDSIIEHVQENRGNHWQLLADSTYPFESERGVIIMNPNLAQASVGESTSVRQQSATQALSPPDDNHPEYEKKQASLPPNQANMQKDYEGKENVTPSGRSTSIQTKTTMGSSSLKLPTTDQELFTESHAPSWIRKAVASVRECADSNEVCADIAKLIDLSISADKYTAQQLVDHGNTIRNRLGTGYNNKLVGYKDLEDYFINMPVLSTDNEGQGLMHYATTEDNGTNEDMFSCRNDNNGCVMTTVWSVPRALATEELRHHSGNDESRARLQPPQVSIIDHYPTSLQKPNSELDQGDEVLDTQLALISNRLGITPEQALLINWSLMNVGNVIYVKEHNRPQPTLLTSKAVAEYNFGLKGGIGKRTFQTNLMNVFESPHGEVLLSGRQICYKTNTQHIISSNLKRFWGLVINDQKILSDAFQSNIAEWYGKKDHMTPEAIEDRRRAQAAGRARADEIGKEARNHYDTSILAEFTPIEAVAAMIDDKKLSSKHVNKFLNEQRFGLESKISKEMMGGAVVSDKRIKQLAANRGLTESDFDIDRIRDNAKSQRSNKDDMAATVRKGKSDEEFSKQQKANAQSGHNKKMEEDIQASDGHGFTLFCPGIRANGSCTFTRTIGRDTYNDMSRQRFACEHPDGTCFPNPNGGRSLVKTGWTAKPFCQDCRNQEQCQNCKGKISTISECKKCIAERDTGVKNKGIRHDVGCPKRGRDSRKKKKDDTSTSQEKKKKKKKNSSSNSSSNAPQKKTKKRKPTSTSSSAPAKKLKGVEIEKKKRKKIDPRYRFFDPAPAPAPKAPAPAPKKKEEKTEGWKCPACSCTLKDRSKKRCIGCGNFC